MTEAAEQPAALTRNIGVLLFAACGVGNIVGAGIYVLVGEVAGLAGWLIPLVFIVVATIAVFSGLSYGELAARYPVCAVESVYFCNIFRRRSLSILTGLQPSSAALVFALTLPLINMAQITSGPVLFGFVLVNLSLLRIRRREPSPPGV